MSDFSQIIHRAWKLDPDIFLQFQQDASFLWIALTIVALASLSEAMGQSVVLFINQVRPQRFVLSLVIATARHIIGYCLWTTIIWLMITYLFNIQQSWLLVARVVGLSYAPQLLAFFGLTPFLGNPFSWILSFWSLLAIIVAINMGLELALWQAIAASGLGWFLIQVWQRTLGRPIYSLGRWIEDRAAGVPLKFTLQDLPGLRRWQPTLPEHWEQWLTQRSLLNYENSRRIFIEKVQQYKHRLHKTQQSLLNPHHSDLSTGAIGPAGTRHKHD